MNFFNETKREATVCLEPFKHLVIDDFLHEDVANTLADQFPKVDDNWYKYDNVFEKKRAIDDISNMPAVHSITLSMFNMRPMIEMLERLTNIKGLIPDPWLRGGGLHQILPGGKLDIHIDFNKHHHLNLHRRLNVLLYLNKDWKEEYGGHLELWDQDMNHCVKKISPIFNRLVIFETTDTAYHGHPDPLMCPEGMTRKSMAWYFYTRDGSLVEPHSTMFKARPTDTTNDEIEALRAQRNKGRV